MPEEKRESAGNDDVQALGADQRREASLLARARGGDEQAFRELIEPRRTELHAHCYRMLGSVDDADDAVQETLLRAWRGLSGFQQRSSLRAWLYRVATNTCLTAISRRSREPAQMASRGSSVPTADESDELVGIEPYPDQLLDVPAGYVSPDARYELRESVELAFIVALQHLPARQRAVLIMRDVLGFSAREVAESLRTSEAAVKSSLQRARGSVEHRLPEQSQQATLRALGDRKANEIVERYMSAWERGDLDGFVAMLTDDAQMAMPPSPLVYRGRHRIAAFCAAGPMSGELSWRHVALRTGGQLAVGCYAWTPTSASTPPGRSMS